MRKMIVNLGINEEIRNVVFVLFLLPLLKLLQMYPRKFKIFQKNSKYLFVKISHDFAKE
jgi:hypothetical protein